MTSQYILKTERIQLEQQATQPYKRQTTNNRELNKHGSTSKMVVANIHTRATPSSILQCTSISAGLVAILLLGTTIEQTAAFTAVNRYKSLPSTSSSSSSSSSSLNPTLLAFSDTRTTTLWASASGGGEKKKRRKRKRKTQPAETTTKEETKSTATVQADIPAVSTPPPPPPPAAGFDDADFDGIPDEEEIDVDLIRDVASFKFDGPAPTADASGTGTAPASSDDETLTSEDSNAIPLPDIKDTIRRKEMEVEMQRIQEEELEKTKIDRTDRKALLKLLEQDPYADADDSFFQEQEYTTVSALLGERAKPFLGIPTGPLQVGHFIGALVIVLMAFVEYPGFPLTNLPTPLRGALQGGLGTVYAINIVLAILASFKAGERGQPALLWVAKTFTVGGLAYDQLTQLPTLEQVEEMKARKGKRALSKQKKDSLNKYNN